MNPQATCYKCSKVLDSASVGRRDTCPACDADVRVCYNCKFYDAKAYNECAEPSADRVVDKDKANFCDYFSAGANSKQGGKIENEALKKLNDLFK